ncbi:hypothetical protein STEG23_008756, partial [Scotinomys teguina]
MSGKLGKSSLEGFMSAILSDISLAWKPPRSVDNISVTIPLAVLGPVKVAVNTSASDMRKEKLGIATLRVWTDSSQGDRWMYVYHVCNAHSGQKRTEPLELEFQTIVSCHAGAGNRAQVFWVKQLSHLQIRGSRCRVLQPLGALNYPPKDAKVLTRCATPVR